MRVRGQLSGTDKTTVRKGGLVRYPETRQSRWQGVSGAAGADFLSFPHPRDKEVGNDAPAAPAALVAPIDTHRCCVSGFFRGGRPNVNVEAGSRFWGWVAVSTPRGVVFRHCIKRLEANEASNTAGLRGKVRVPWLRPGSQHGRQALRGHARLGWVALPRPAGPRRDTTRARRYVERLFGTASEDGP